MMLAGAYFSLEPDLVPQALGYARIGCRMWLGEDETFRQTHAAFAGQPVGCLISVR